MKNLRTLTLLHSNDLHGDFMAKSVDEKLIGGVSRLSGYVHKVREEEENVLYAIAGDMFRGSVIDSEYKGLSTIQIMNYLGPDVATLGNHEVDYGLAHLLFVEKLARFPLINANMYITTTGTRLFRSHIILNVNGIKVMFIGILTEEVLSSARQERIVGSFVDVREAAEEVGRICNSYQTEDIDLTVLLTHIGYEEDLKLAALLKPEWGVDLIIGGHSHTLLEKPGIVNGIPVVQAAVGTAQIGRFDLQIDMDRNCIDSYTWQCVPIDEEHCPVDEQLAATIQLMKEETDQKYMRYITRFAEQYKHLRRDRESDVGCIFADTLRDALGVDLMLVGMGSLRSYEIGPVVTLRDLSNMYPYPDRIYRITITGKLLKKMIAGIFRPEHFESDHVENYAFSSGIYIEESLSEKKVVKLLWHGEEINDEEIIRVGIQNYHYENITAFMALTAEDITSVEKPKVLTTNAMDVLDEHFSSMEYVTAPQDARWVTLE